MHRQFYNGYLLKNFYLFKFSDMSRMTYALLLKECKGYKETGQTYSEKTVQAGNLLEALKDMEVAIKLLLNLIHH